MSEVGPSISARRRVAPLRRLAGALVVAVVLAPGIARGAGAADSARAEALFAEGRRLMAALDFAAACGKFAESEELDPAPGTALNLAVCYEKAGKLASAWAAFKLAQAKAQAAGQGDRAATARKTAADLEVRLSRLTIDVPAAARMPGLEVRCDGEVVGQAEWGVAVPRDGGEHTITASAQGKKPWTRRVELQPSAQRLEIEVPALEGAPAAQLPPPGAPTTVSSGETGGSALPAAAPSRRGGATQRTVAVVVGAVGAAGAAFGVVAGLVASSNWNEAKSACGGHFPECPATSSAFGLRDTSVAWATASTVGFVAGGAALAAGAVLFVTAPRDPVAPVVRIAPAPGGAHVVITQRF